MAAESSNFASPCIPKFDGDYEHWNMLMENLLRSKEYWSVIETRYVEPASGEILNNAQKKTLEETKLKDLKVKNYLFQSIDKSILKTITQKDTAKQLWDSMKIKYQGNTRVRRAQLQIFRRNFEVLEMKQGESVTNYFGRVMLVANDMQNLGENIPDEKIVEKILRTLTEKYNYIVCSIEESKDINHLSVDELQSSLFVHEQKFKRHDIDDHALRIYDDRFSGRGRGRSNYRGRGSGGRTQVFNRDMVECFRCHKLGHFQYECPTMNKAANYVELDEEDEMLLMSYVTLHKTTRNDAWFLDSRCSNHMCGYRGMFSYLDDNFQHSVKLGNNSRMAVVGKGRVKLLINGIKHVVNDVYYVPELKNNLLSIGQLQERGLAILIKNGICKIYHPEKGLIIQTQMSANRMFILLAQTQAPVHAQTQNHENCLHTSSQNPSYLWHRRFGHLSYKGLRTLQWRHMVHGLPTFSAPTITCTDCLNGKQHREVMPKHSIWRANQKLELIHADICGPISPESNSGKRYILCFIDDFSRKSWVFLLATKSEAFFYFKQFKAMVEKETLLHVKCLRTDRGGEFTSNDFNEFCSQQGIKRQLTTTYTPQ